MEDDDRLENNLAVVDEDDPVILRAGYGSPDHPLCIGDIEIPCYVLEDERRVLVQGAMIAALGMARGGPTKYSTGDRLTRFTGQKALEPHISRETALVIANPVKFRTPNGAIAYGYEATILPDICEAVLRARDEGRLQSQQMKIAQRCELLIRGFARVGIIALVDEATGYQEYRARLALEEILTKFISEELRKWVKTFPDEFYRELFRLRGLSYSEVSSKRPVLLGRLTNDIVYRRLAPGVLEELQRITPKLPSGRRQHKYHQRLTEDIGHPRLREHLASVITLMKASPNWSTFHRLLQRSMPKYSDQLLLPFIEDDDQIE